MQFTMLTARVTAISGNTLLTVSNFIEIYHTFTINEQVIVMQMQDDVIGTNTVNSASFGNIESIGNAGVYEVRTISAINRNNAGTTMSITLSESLASNFNTSPNSRVQVISFTKLGVSAFATSNTISCLTWNGATGGVVAIQVTNTLIINHPILANGSGFSGGSRSVNYSSTSGTNCTTADYVTGSTNCGFKGEGIFAVTSNTQTNGIAKIANGGGGGGQDSNGGGGGGGNYTFGGVGGKGVNAYDKVCTGPDFPSGLGGVALSANININRVFMGGGGGGGQGNYNESTNGGRGGGIILIKANTIRAGCSATPIIAANGISSRQIRGSDGKGGGGAGGSIVIQASNFLTSPNCSLQISANGSDGGSVFDFRTSSGGGAGAQGVIIFSSAQPTNNITTSTKNGLPGCNNTDCTSKAGPAGGTDNMGIISNATNLLPIELLYFTAKNKQNEVYLNWATASEKNTSHFLVKRSINGYIWSIIDRVDAAGFSKTTRFYSSIDYNPPKGNVYYLITSVDVDRSEQNSSLQVVERNAENALVVLYPNPAHNILNVAPSHNEKNTKIEIYDARGVQKIVKIIKRLDNKITLDISRLTEGIYFVRCINHNKSTTSKLIISR